jgi:hypothetical protein
MTVKRFAWMSNPQYLAQVGHFLGGVCLVVVTALFARYTWLCVWIAVGIGVACATFKELVFDVSSWGEGDSWGDSFMDLGFYLLGGAVGLGLTALAFHFGR